MSEMIERVAQAIAAVDSVDYERRYQRFARAAVEAMREPTDAMRDASYCGEEPGEPNSFDRMWELAINQALAP